MRSAPSVTTAAASAVTRAAATAVTAAAAAVVLLAGCAGGAGGGAATTAPAGATTTGAASPTTAPSPTPPSPVREQALPVYYVAETAAGLRLYREFHAVRTADPASDAVREMLAKPTGFDPDYRSSWPSGTRLRAPVTRSGGVITVDLSGEARSASVGAELAELTVQQLVYTVQGAAQSTDPVRILVDGSPVGELWGHVSTEQPVGRADPYATRSLVQIDNPANGAQVGRTFTVSGEAAVFEATLPWQVLRDGTVVRSGTAMTAEGQRFSAFSFSLTLDPGVYTVRITEDDPSGGAGRPPGEDTKAIRVAG